jgi:hypothetical protein
VKRLFGSDLRRLFGISVAKVELFVGIARKCFDR